MLIKNTFDVIIILRKVVNLMSNIGNNIKERRESLGMSQDELAEKMGYKSRSTIAKIEKGVNDVTQTNIVKFAEILKTTPAYLMGWEKVEKKADTISDVVLRMKTDPDFCSLVEKLNTLDSEKINGVKQMLSAFVQ